ncbi:Hypothetical predicted protein [Octopus vulgaris]|uniref:Uncharacterized protein n=1 Tax=Octopus vulgaris TaxID=6645 RepID=A0AA36B6Z4_OCTVU|nr:Hypothetical predicted protein [Octopus vulgaris]
MFTPLFIACVVFSSFFFSLVAYGVTSVPALLTLVLLPIDAAFVDQFFYCATVVVVGVANDDDEDEVQWNVLEEDMWGDV